MADTAIKTEEEKKEYFDDPETLDQKVTQLAGMIREANHFTCFTGAGISTSTGIPDYRSGYGTVLETGPGCWEKAAYKQKYKDELIAAGKQLPNCHRVPFNMTIQQARPSLCHMALVELYNRDMLKHVISQNVDGLHRKSGIPAFNLSELHGNTNLELCVKCGREHMRDFRVRTAQKVTEHLTGRKCDTPGCNGDLKDTIINFGEKLNIPIMEGAFAQSHLSDLMLCMGSSMRVAPASLCPLSCINNNFVMVNLQKTNVDHHAALVIHAKIDDVMKMLMEKLDMPIPEFRRSYRLKVSLSGDSKTLSVMGVDANGACYTLFKALTITGLSPAATTYPKTASQKQPYTLAKIPTGAKSFTINCQFQGHYDEPNVTLTVPMDLLKANKSIEFCMIYHVANKVFQQVQMIKSDDSRAALGDAKFSTKLVEPRAASPAQTSTKAKGAAASTMNALKAGGGAMGSAANRSGSQRAGGAAASTTKNRSISGGRRNPAQPGTQVGTRGVTKKGPVAKGKKGPGLMGMKGAAIFKQAQQDINTAKITYADLAAEENKEEAKKASEESDEEH